MTIGRIGEAVKEQFTVLDMGNNLVDSIPTGEFTVNLYDPTDSEIYNGSNVTVSELGDGHYYAEFTPGSIGDYMLVVYHATYFPWGKSNNIKVFNNDFDTISVIVERILGLTQENYYVYDTVYNDAGNMTNSKIKIYEQGFTVGGATGVIAEYNVVATWDDLNMETYAVTKV